MAVVSRNKLPLSRVPRGFSKTVTTNANGEIDHFPDLAPGTYTITEESIDRYVPNQSQTITVASDQTTSVSVLITHSKNSELTVTKQDYEKGHAQGDAKFRRCCLWFV